MTRIVTILTEGFADWETSLLNAVAHGFYAAETLYASAGGKALTSMGNMNVQPRLAIADIDPAGLDALVICGGAGWKQADAPDISAVARRVHDAGKVVAAICDGTLALARTGLLDHVAHTSNGVGYLDETGYGGAPLYRDTPVAVADRRIDTAPGTSPISFLERVYEGIGLADDQLRYSIGLHAAQYGTPAVRAA
jgi:putative intracellular protease/amidase